MVWKVRKTKGIFSVNGASWFLSEPGSVRNFVRINQSQKNIVWSGKGIHGEIEREKESARGRGREREREREREISLAQSVTS